LRETRAQLAQGLGVHPLELIFTSGGSESNNTVITGRYLLGQDLVQSLGQRNEWITSTIEHPSVLKTFKWLESIGQKVHYVRVSKNGRLDLDFYQAVLSQKTALVSIMAANNETGVIYPTKELCRQAHSVGALFHTDAVQALGKFPVDLKDWNVDYASFSAHKFYALKGIGILFAKKGAPFQNLVRGGGQERGRRAGTENVLGLAAIGAMASRLQEINNHSRQMESLRDYFEFEVVRRIQGVNISCVDQDRLPNTSHLVIAGADGESLLMNLDMAGFAVSTGAACSSGSPEPSPVLLSMGFSRDEAQSSLRVSLGWRSTRQEVESFLSALVQVVDRLRTIDLNFRQQEA
jgi:cysteine desulfurase